MTPLFKMVITLVVFVMLHSAVALFIDLTALGAGDVRVLAWARQVAALVAGISVFLVLRKSLISVSDQFIIRAVVAGALPALGLASLNLLWGLTGNAVAGRIVSHIRSTLIPLGYTHPSRASGLSLEPSHFAFYLVAIVIPITFVAFARSRRGLQWIGLGALVLAAFAWALSMTGFITLFSFVLAGLLLGPRRRLFAISTIVILLLGLGILALFPDSYIVHAAKNLVSGQWGLSIVNHLYGGIGPFLKVHSSYTLLGYGLGGTSTHFREMVPEVAWGSIEAISWEGMPSLGGLLARILAESGLFGLLLFALVIGVSYRESRYGTSRSLNGLNISLMRISRLALVAVLVRQTMGQGSYSLPYLWFWLSLIDSRYIVAMKSYHG